MMVAAASASVIPAVERWGVLVTNLGAAVVLAIGALYVLILISFSHPVASKQPPSRMRCLDETPGA